MSNTNQSERTFTDLAARIQFAMNRGDDPVQKNPQAVPENGTVIGVVPQHLRHLSNLHVEINEEIKELLKKIEKLQMQESLVAALLDDGLDIDDNKPVNVAILEDWQIVEMPAGNLRDKIREMMNGMGNGFMNLDITGVGVDDMPGMGFGGRRRAA